MCHGCYVSKSDVKTAALLMLVVFSNYDYLCNLLSPPYRFGIYLKSTPHLSFVLVGGGIIIGGSCIVNFNEQQYLTSSILDKGLEHNTFRRQALQHIYN